MTDLDTLLSAPLEPVDDAGFSSRVVSRVTKQQIVVRERREMIEWSLLLVATLLFLLAVPLPALNSVIEYITLNVSSSLPVGVAVGVIILTTTWLRSTERI